MEIYKSSWGKSNNWSRHISVLFTDGWRDIKEKIIRGKCETLKQAITLGIEEEIYLRKFSLYSGGYKYGQEVDN